MADFTALRLHLATTPPDWTPEPLTEAERDALYTEHDPEVMDADAIAHCSGGG